MVMNINGNLLGLIKEDGGGGFCAGIYTGVRGEVFIVGAPSSGAETGAAGYGEVCTGGIKGYTGSAGAGSTFTGGRYGFTGSLTVGTEVWTDGSGMGLTCLGSGFGTTGGGLTVGSAGGFAIGSSGSGGGTEEGTTASFKGLSVAV